MYLSLFLLITEGRSVKAVHRETPPRCCDLSPAPGNIGAIGALSRESRAGQLCGDPAQDQPPEFPRWEMCSGGFLPLWNSHQHSSALGSVRCSNSIWSWKVWLCQLSKTHTFFVFLQVLSHFSVSSLWPGCIRRKQM